MLKCGVDCRPKRPDRPAARGPNSRGGVRRAGSAASRRHLTYATNGDPRAPFQILIRIPPHSERILQCHRTKNDRLLCSHHLRPGLTRNRENSVVGSVGVLLALLSEQMLRYTSLLATEKRDAMDREGCEKEVDTLVAAARACRIRCTGVERTHPSPRSGECATSAGPAVNRPDSRRIGRIAAHGVRNAAGWAAHGDRVSVGDGRGRRAPGR